MATIINSVDLAKDVKDLVIFSTVKFNDDAIKNKIFATDDNNFLLISKSIDSDPTIIDAVLVDDDFVRKAVLG
ncbi:MAG: hypothetical protein ABIJ05_04600 [Patescibacteria group bacterium]